MAVHYKAEHQDPNTATTGLLVLYPHTPDNVQLSVQDYLEDNFANGWEFVGILPTSSEAVGTYIFKANGQ